MLKPLLAALIRPLPQWSAVAVEPPQRLVSVRLSWPGGSRDITADHAVASLRPLTLAISATDSEVATLDFLQDGESLGTLDLARSGSVRAPSGGTITLYGITGGYHRCLPWPLRPWNERLQSRAAGRNRTEGNFSLTPGALRHLMICYICPRPVVLVSVAGPDHFNIFPMDLIGPVGPHVTLALRSTNVSIPVMRETGQAVLSCVPAQMKPVAYQLGERHASAQRDAETLPFALRPSPILGIPAVAAALRTRELAIRHAEEIGSHIFFIADILSDDQLADGRQLHHVSGLYKDFRRRHGVPLPGV